MKMKRILSILLSSAVLSSCLPIMAENDLPPAVEIRSGEITEFEAEDYAEIFDSYAIEDYVPETSFYVGFSKKFVYVPDTSELNLAVTPPNDRSPGLKIHFDIKEAGDYNVWTYVWTKDGGTCTQYIRFDEGAYSMVEFDSDEVNYPRGRWTWQMIGAQYLEEGRHTLGFTQRHKSVGFDKFIITTVPDFSPSGIPLSTPEFLPEYGESAEYEYNLPPVVPPANQHPRVLMNSSMIPEIRANLEHEQNKATYEMLISRAATETDGKLPQMSNTQGSNISESVLTVMKANAFLYAVNGDMAAGEKAVTIAKNVAQTAQGRSGSSDEMTRKGGAVLFAEAIVYDWCYDLMTDEERKSMRSYLYRLASFLEVSFPVKSKSGNIWGHDCEMQIWKDLFALSIAIYDEDPKMYNNVAGRIFDQMIPIRNYLNNSLKFNEGVLYGPFRFACELFATYLLRGMGYENVFEKQQQYALYGMFYQRRADGRMFNTGDNSNEELWGFTNDSDSAYFLAGNFYKDPLLKRDYYKKVKNGMSNSDTATGIDPVLHLIVNDVDVPVNASYDNLPLSAYSGDIMGTMYARTSWDEGMDADSVAVQMTTPEYFFGGHSHKDAGHFDVYYKGNLALDSGAYESDPFVDQDGNLVSSNLNHGSKHHSLYDTQTIAHNAMLVTDPSETAYNIYHKVNYNHSGQKDYTASGHNYENLEEFKIGDVLGWDFGPDLRKPAYSYLKGEIGGAYSSKVKDYQRSFMFLNLFDEEYPAALIVLDNISTSNPTFKKTWLLHTQEEPVIEGNKTTVKRTAFGNNGRLINETLYPENASIEKIGGKGKEWYYNGWNYGIGIKTAVQEAGAWRIEVSPKKAEEKDYFLNVMQLSENNDTIEPLKAELIRDDDKYFGIKIKDRAVFLKKDSNLVLDDLTFEVYGDEEVMYIIDGLREGKWTVTDSNGKVVDVCNVEKDHHVLQFTAEAGEYKLRWDYTSHIKTKDYSIQANIRASEEIVIDVMTDSVFESFKNELYMKNGELYIPIEEYLTKRNKEYISENGEYTTVSKNSDNVTVTVDDEKNGICYASLENLCAALGYKYSFDSIAYIARIETGENILDKLKLVNSDEPDRIRIYDATASKSETASPYDTVDGNIGSYWAAQGDDEWIMYEFEEPSEISHIDIRWHQGHTRVETFEIFISTDGNEWTEVFRGASSGNSNTFERHDIAAEGKYKFVRINGHGNTNNSWNSLSEIQFYNNYTAQK